jgi:hypothetical protein
MFLARTLRTIAAAVLGLAFVPPAAFSQDLALHDDRILPELAAMDERGGTIMRVREQVIRILQSENRCTAWFQGSDPDPAGVFQSLHYEIQTDGPSYILLVKDGRGEKVFKHPWGARTFEFAGRDSTVQLNLVGPFFSSTSVVVEQNLGGFIGRTAGRHGLSVASFPGNTPRAQATILLHELGHVIGRLPADNDSLDGRSSRNTAELLRHCKQQIETVTP